MAALMYHLFSSASLVSLGLYHLISAAHSHLKSPQSYSARPYHPLPLHNRPFLRHLQLYLLIICLLIAAAVQAASSTTFDPLVKGNSPVHRFTSLHSAAILLLFLIVSLSILLSDSLLSLFPPIPTDLVFALASAAFYLQYSASSSAAAAQTSDLEGKCDSISSLISAFSALLCLALAVNTKLFIADFGLGASICLQGLWVLQTGLSLYVEAFIPEGCHRLLDVASGVESSTKCDLDESKLRALAILDLVFAVHVMFVMITVLSIYAAVAKGVGARKLGSYEALPITGDRDRDTNSHIQMKSLTGTQA
ncbi:hypothetical protein SAY86_014251 [Trapa natans]|uniref:Plant viral-response family protein n=1 Tax=Trapa natans TaxID=22666 RepID=A0AAN7L090_TRANT|nr:hypothetical protein SAY86_014251 [Trapa natans]